MALSRRRGDRFSGSIWPGFVDAMTALLLVLMFVLSIFMIVQFMLRETITGQESELDLLTREVAELADALGLEESRASALEGQVGRLTATLGEARTEAEAQQAEITELTAEAARQQAELSAAAGRITDFEAQVARLLLERDAARDQGAALSDTVASLEAERDMLAERNASLGEERDALTTALATARTEIDAQVETARLAAARREALEALVADLNRQKAEAEGTVTALEGEAAELSERLSEEEAARLAEAAAAEALRERLSGAETELTAMTLALEQERRQAEETLTLLAAARAAEAALDDRLAALALERLQLEEALASEAKSAQDLAMELDVARKEIAAALAARLAAEQESAASLGAAEQRAALLAEANRQLEQQEAESAESLRRVALLNAQVAELRKQIGSLQGLLSETESRAEAGAVEIATLGARLNVALAAVAEKEQERATLAAERAELARERAELEAAERKRLEEEKARLEAEARDLKNYRSEFFGRLRDVLGGREGVRIEGDRFVFSSEVLFPSASASLSPEGQAQVARVANILSEISDELPDEIDWVIRVDGHTDDTPLTGTGVYADNWELSQARALSVVRFMTDQLGFPPYRLAANGFAEFQPIDLADTPEARARNRRIELKLTER